MPTRNIPLAGRLRCVSNCRAVVVPPCAQIATRSRSIVSLVLSIEYAARFRTSSTSVSPGASRCTSAAVMESAGPTASQGCVVLVPHPTLSVARTTQTSSSSLPPNLLGPKNHHRYTGIVIRTPKTFHAGARAFPKHAFSVRCLNSSGILKSWLSYGRTDGWVGWKRRRSDSS